MNAKEFEEKFHELYSVYSDKSNEMGEKLKKKYEEDRARLSVEIDEEMFDEIGKLFKMMTFEDKVNFLEKYVQKKRLAKYLEPHELSALLIMEWPYIGLI